MNKEYQTLDEQLLDTKPSLATRAKKGFENYLIDTSAKVGCYIIPMATLEASLGLSLGQIARNRAISALTDFFVAKSYLKILDKVRTSVHKPEGGYLMDTLTMIAVYSPPYAAILAYNGADGDQIISGLIKGALVAAATARIFTKYALKPWRKKWGYHTKAQFVSEPKAMIEINSTST